MADKTATTPVAELTGETQQLVEHFGESVQPAEYEGVVIDAAKLVEAATHIRDELGYNYLSSLTAVDYLKEGYFEVVYHAYRLAEGGGPLVFKARTPRDVAKLPSLTPVWRGAELQEREAWDLMGISFEDHPDLRRILLWEGFEGHPLRKDWKEPYYEADAKPFKSRWPDGQHVRAEDRVEWHDNVQYPQGWNPETFTPETKTLLYKGLTSVPESGGNGHDAIHTDEVIVSMGPQHPSTHGVFRMVVSLQGETIVNLKPVIGYLHRNHEKIGERNTYIQNMPFTDRLDYIASMSNNFGYAITVEKLMGIAPPERAEYIRVIMAEFTRIISHLVAIGFLFNDLGAYFTPALYGLEERERILDLFEMASGSRMMCNYFRFGGVAKDVSEDFIRLARELAFERLPGIIDEFERYLNNNEIFRERTIGVGVLSTEDAIRFSTSGPLLRASNVPYDVRRAEPYSIYDRFDFDVVTRPTGDVYDRYIVRIEEVRQSVRILQQALDQIPEGEIQTGKKKYQDRVAAGQAYGRVEGPKGELGFYVVSDGSINPYRYHIRAPTFINITPLVEMCKGFKVADVVVILGSIDIVLGEVDR